MSELFNGLLQGLSEAIALEQGKASKKNRLILCQKKACF